MGYSAAMVFAFGWSGSFEGFGLGLAPCSYSSRKSSTSWSLSPAVRRSRTQSLRAQAQPFSYEDFAATAP